jgi:hypothetical protein
VLLFVAQHQRAQIVVEIEDPGGDDDARLANAEHRRSQRIRDEHGNAVDVA